MFPDESKLNIIVFGMRISGGGDGGGGGEGGGGGDGFGGFGGGEGGEGGGGVGRGGGCGGSCKNALATLPSSSNVISSSSVVGSAGGGDGDGGGCGDGGARSNVYVYVAGIGVKLLPPFDVALNTSIPSSNIRQPGSYVGRQSTISISDTGDSASMVNI